MTNPWVETPGCDAYGAVRYDAGTRTLCLRFNNGRVYCYQNVGEKEALELTFGVRRGHYFNTQFKGRKLGVEVVSTDRQGAPV